MNDDTTLNNNTPENDAHSTPLEFPCDFIIKVMGKNNTEFETQVLSITRTHFPKLTDEQIKKRPSKDANYLALSISVHAQSKEQLDALYQELSNEPTILMAL